jgi:hypothetical protein
MKENKTVPLTIASKNKILRSIYNEGGKRHLIRKL